MFGVTPAQFVRSAAAKHAARVLDVRPLGAAIAAWPMLDVVRSSRHVRSSVQSFRHPHHNPIVEQSGHNRCLRPQVPRIRRTGPLVPGIVQSTTYTQDRVGEYAGPTYSRVANPASMNSKPCWATSKTCAAQRRLCHGPRRRNGTLPRDLRRPAITRSWAKSSMAARSASSARSWQTSASRARSSTPPTPPRFAKRFVPTPN